jgi:hypothetical protein
LKLGLKEAPSLLRRTLADRFDGKKTELMPFLAAARRHARGSLRYPENFLDRS